MKVGDVVEYREGGYFDASVRIETPSRAHGGAVLIFYPSSRRLRDVVLAERAKAVRS